MIDSTLRAAAAALLLASPALHAAASDAPPRDLDAALQAIVDQGALASARAGIMVANVETGKVLYARDPDALLNPASNVKLFTSAAALARLGPEYRFDTEFYVDAAAAGSATPKVLYVRGKGDPSLVTERLWAVAGDLAHLGLRRIGDLVLDDRFFDAEREGPGFDQEAGDRSYLAPVGALSLNFNSVAIHVAPGDRTGQKGRVELEPASDFFELVNRTTTGPGRGGRRVKVSSIKLNGRQQIVVEGRIPAGSRDQAIYRKIDDPASYLGYSLKRLLELRGVKVTGRVRTGAVPGDAKLVHVEQSESLGEIVRRLNKTSNNFTAEQILKALGAEVKGAPGTWPKGVAAVEEFLEDVGIRRGTYVMRNGSGLNDTNRFSARQVVTLLRAMWARFPLQAEYLSSLPVAGRDGTTRWRMEGTPAAGHLRAKTGTLEHVTSLSGYVETAGHETLAFSILVNDYAGRHATAVRAVDAVGATLAAAGGTPAELSAAVALARGPASPQVGGPDLAHGDVSAAVRTYYALGRAADARKVPFLRTALRGEADPVVRMAIAECIYLSDPDGETSRRTFLEAVSTDPAALARLFASADPAGPAPVLPSLAELAADGSVDALARLVELAPASAAGPGPAAAIASALADVAASAPEEIVTALRAAPPVTADAAVGALSTGLVRAGPPEHPFLAALHGLAGRQGDAALFARALEGRLRDGMASARVTQTAPTLVPATTVLPAGARK